MSNTSAESRFPADWPGPGPIDLGVHDLPHASSTTEWWYQNTHLETVTGRKLSLFASFFTIVSKFDEVTKRPDYAYSCTWALSDPARQAYIAESRVDKRAAAMGLKKMERGEGSSDNRLQRAMREVLEKGKVPLPDVPFVGEPFVSWDKLELDFDGNQFRKNDDGTYTLVVRQRAGQYGAELVFTPRKPPIRHGADGVVRGAHNEDMFYYFMPRCDVTGVIHLPGGSEPVKSGQGWYDHEFGRHAKMTDKKQEGEDIGWTWLGLQLDDGTEVSGYALIEEDARKFLDARTIVVWPDASRGEHTDTTLTPSGAWCSTRTFAEYPTTWRLEVPSIQLDLTLQADFDDQEFITLISKPGFWEGRCSVTGTLRGKSVSGLGYLERSGQNDIDNLDQFFGAVGKQVRKSVNAVMPLQPTAAEALTLIAGPDRPQAIDGVDIQQFADYIIKPIREITDRGGKSWRSYAALACCDVVGGDSRQFVQWLAMPELMHVGSLIVDDVQDRSDVRRGGPTVHLLYGDATAINAGTAAYFLGQKLLHSERMSDRDKLRIYDLYFETLRAGHAGQALDIAGLDDAMPDAVARGDGVLLERRVLAVHRLKTAVPAATLARMGAIAGNGSEAQIEGVGNFFESVGLAFQIIDDVLNLRGFKGELKSRGEDIAHGKVTLPVAKAIARLGLAERESLWATLRSKSHDQAVIDGVIAQLDACGAIDACEVQAREMIEAAWAQVEPLVQDTLPKLMLRAFGWYVLERHY